MRQANSPPDRQIWLNPPTHAHRAQNAVAPFAWPRHHMDPALPQSQPQECLGSHSTKLSYWDFSTPSNPGQRATANTGREPCREPAGESEPCTQDSDCRRRMETLRTKGNASRAKTTGSRATRESWAVRQSSHTAGRVGDAEFSWTRIVSDEAGFHTSRWRREGNSQSCEQIGAQAWPCEGGFEGAGQALGSD
jgi:hypothetical protein